MEKENLLIVIEHDDFTYKLIYKTIRIKRKIENINIYIIFKIKNSSGKKLKGINARVELL